MFTIRVNAYQTTAEEREGAVSLDLPWGLIETGKDNQVRCRVCLSRTYGKAWIGRADDTPILLLCEYKPPRLRVGDRWFALVETDLECLFKKGLV